MKLGLKELVKLTARDVEIIKIFELNHPSTKERSIELGAIPEYVSRGISRDVYRFGDTLCVKFPQGSSYNLIQARHEIEAIKKIKKNVSSDFEILKCHVPPIYYWNTKTGVLITKFYPYLITDQEYREEAGHLVTLLDEHVGVRDMHSNNFRRDHDRTIVAIDLGGR